MNKNLILSGLMLAAFFSGCRKDAEFTIPSAEAGRLLHTWRLAYSYNGWSGPATPATLGYEQHISFDREGQYLEFRNQELTLIKPYRFVSPASTLPPDQGVQIGDRTFFCRISPAGDSLYLDPTAYDATGYTYVRDRAVVEK